MTTSTTSTTNKGLLLKFRETDTLVGITRESLRELAAKLGFNETQAVHYALARLARDVLPSYAPDDGPLTEQQLDTIRKAVPQGRATRVRSSLL